jgi:hypothetical protein
MSSYIPWRMADGTRHTAHSTRQVLADGGRQSKREDGRPHAEDAG